MSNRFLTNLNEKKTTDLSYVGGKKFSSVCILIGKPNWYVICYV